MDARRRRPGRSRSQRSTKRDNPGLAGTSEMDASSVCFMLKRWAVWPRGIRWAVAIAAAVLALVIMWALFVPLADWLAHHDVGSVKGTLHETAVDNARGRLLTLGAGLLAAGALIFTALNFNLLRRNSEQTDQWQRRTYELTEQGQVTDRYTKAIKQFGSKKLDVRIGGIYALERVARDSARDHPTVMEVLTAFIREHSHEQWPPSDHLVSRRQERSTRPDVQAALTVIGRRDPECDIRRIDLTGADLTRAMLATAHLDGAVLADADLTGADLTRAMLANAHLIGANLTGARLADARLTRAMLATANLAGAHLADARLTDAVLPALTSPTRSSPALTSPARSSPTHVSLTRTSPAPGGAQMRQFRRAGN